MDQVKITGYVPGAIGKITELHATWYHRHWSFGPYFERKVATELSEFFGRFDEKEDGLWLAAFEGCILGSIAIDGIKRENKGAHLRWFIVDTEYQGQGIGTMLIRKALEFCEKCRYRRVYLWTFAGLNGARHLYETHGFSLCQEHEDSQWGVILREQMFERLFEL